MNQAAINNYHEQTIGTKNGWQTFANRAGAILDGSPADETLVAWQLQSPVDQLYRGLAADPAFQEQLANCPQELAAGIPTWASVLFENDAIKGGLLGVYKDKPIPLHDHPGCGAVVLVLAGEVNLQYANITSSRGGLAELEIARTRDCAPGQIDWFTANDRNIHRVESLTDRAVLLVAHLPHIEPDRQQLYFPLTDYEPATGCRFLAQRMPLVRGGNNIHSVN